MTRGMKNLREDRNTMTKRLNTENNGSYESRGVRGSPRIERRSHSDSVRVTGSQFDRNERTMVSMSQRSHKTRTITVPAHWCPR